MTARLAIVAVIPLLATSLVAEPAVRETFEDLDGWAEIPYPSITRKTIYKAVELDGDHALKTMSYDAASAIEHAQQFSVRTHPGLRWR